MSRIIKSQSIAIGLAMFSMFFGAGNIIYPLAVGQYGGDQNFFGALGLIITGVVMPFAGVIAMILFDGNYREFFGRMGRVPGFILALTILTLLGPLGSTPRCIALAYSTLKGSLGNMSPTLFSAIACALIFGLTVKKNHIIAILGKVLTPILLLSLAAIIVLGFTSDATAPSLGRGQANMLWHGLAEGYNTMDLLAAFFFSSTILAALKMGGTPEENAKGSYIGLAFKASIVGAVLLALVYVGFSYVASFHGHELGVTGKDELLTAITMKIAGSSAGVLVSITVALACLTTAIALIAVFAEFVQKEVFRGSASYEITLLGSLLLTFFVATFEFTGISAFLTPVLQICYPALIVLTFANIGHKLINFKTIKAPVALAFAVSAVVYFS